MARVIINSSDEAELFTESNPGHVEMEAGDAALGTVAVTSIAAGDNNIGNVDVASIAAGDNNIGNVDIASIAAGETHIGEVGGKVATVSVNPVLTVAGAYSANDFVGTSATALIFANAVRISGGSGVIQSAILVDAALQSKAAELWLFDTDITPPADNAAWTLSDAHAATCIGIIQFSNYFASALNSVSVARGLGIAFRATATTIWGALVTRGTPTYASLDLTVRLNIMQD